MEHTAESRSFAEHDSLTHAVVTAVAAEKGVEPEAVADRIYDVVDPDGLDRLFSPAGDGTPRENARLTFELAGYQVDIEGGELIMVTPAHAVERRES